MQRKKKKKTRVFDCTTFQLVIHHDEMTIWNTQKKIIHRKKVFLFYIFKKRSIAHWITHCVWGVCNM
jgi:hypothetical protein